VFAEEQGCNTPPPAAKPKQRQVVNPAAGRAQKRKARTAPDAASDSADSQHGQWSDLVPESKYDNLDQAGPSDSKETLNVGQLIIAYNEDDKGHHTVRIVSVDLDHSGVTYETHVYGAYNSKGLHVSKYIPAYTDPKDGKLQFTLKPRPRHKPWYWQMRAGDACSQPFVLKASKSHRTFSLECRYQ
jgi:hypothetical protein